MQISPTTLNNSPTQQPPPHTQSQPPPTTTTKPPSLNKFPPVHIYTQKHTDIIKLINTNVTPSPDFKFNNSALVCHAKSANTHSQLINTLRLNKVEFYSYNLTNFRPHKIVVKYIPIDTPTEDIEQSLRLKNLPFHNISRIMLSRGGKKIPSNILIITIPKESAQAYYKLEELCHLRVTASDYIRLDLPQCHRCQKIGHSSQLCNRAYKCVRCGGGHAGEPCTAPSCKCANCGADHPASYRGCPVYLAAKQRSLPNPIPKPPNNLPTPKPSNLTAAAGATSTTNTHITPSAAPRPPPPVRLAAQPAEAADQAQTNARAWQGFRQRTQPPPQTTTPNTDPDDNPIKEILAFFRSFDLKNIIQNIRNFINTIKTLTDPMDKLILIIETITNFF